MKRLERFASWIDRWLVVIFIVIVLVAVLTGCTSVQVAVPDANAQVRMTEWGGDVGGRSPAVGGEGGGQGCIVSELGTPKGHVRYVGARCFYEVNAPESCLCP